MIARALRLVTGPSVEPIAMAEALLNLRLPASGHPEESRLAALITAARQQSEAICGGRRWIPQTWELVLDGFPPCILLPLAPVIAITSIKYQDLANSQQTLAVSGYQFALDAHERMEIRPPWGSVWPYCYPAMGAAIVRFTAGYDNGSSPADYPGSVPEDAKSAMHLLIADYFEQRQSVTVGTALGSIPRGVEALLSPYMLPPW